MIFVYILRNVAVIALSAAEIAMFARVIMSWFPMFADNVVGDFVYFVTEPLIMPVRKPLEKIEWVKNSPLDIAFFVTFLILSIISDAL